MMKRFLRRGLARLYPLYGGDRAAARENDGDAAPGDGLPHGVRLAPITSNDVPRGVCIHDLALQDEISGFFPVNHRALIAAKLSLPSVARSSRGHHPFRLRAEILRQASFYSTILSYA
jgi:hypothetical protein